MTVDLLGRDTDVRTRLSSIRERPSSVRADAVERVVLVVASSRGGSSYVHAVLSSSPSAASIGGEHTGLYRLHGVERGADGSDRIESDSVRDDQVEDVAAEIADLLRVGPGGTALHPEVYARAAAVRLVLQWPWVPFAADDVRDASFRVHAAAAGAGLSDSDLFVRLLAELEATYPDLRRDAYDGLRDAGPGPASDGPHPPPGPAIVEEPPFVVPLRRRRPSLAELRRSVVVLKASVDAYRLPLVRRLFPRAEIAVVHLTRNPAASVNGLIDGWLDRGFFSYDVSAETTLDIAGYSERAAFARAWWNFDVPPTWRSVADRPLAEVCANQWSQAHRWVLKEVDAVADRLLRVRFENLTGPGADQEWDRVFRFAGLARADRSRIPVVMATASPRAGRWRGREALIRPAIAQAPVHEIVQELGYTKEEGWV
ncbi:hypothetical protein [Promicromonospora sp. NPDC023805]|uniref:hypothetical protein n=1 Tax=Promicromonospora sp. NPDC023805 TaxID=3154696 RepID=UPI0033C7D81E